MGTSMEPMLIEYVANAFWQLPLLAAGAWLLLWASDASPRVQHAVWCAVLFTAVLLPARGITPRALAQAGLEPQGASTSLPEVSQAEAALLGATAAKPSHAVSWRLPLQRHELAVPPLVAHFIFAGYLALLLLAAARLGWSWRGAQKLLARSQPLSRSPELRRAADECASRLRIELPEMRESAELASPAVVGVGRAVLLLPLEFGAGSREQLQAALAHEFAHIRRRDYAVNLLCRLMALPLAFHPATVVVGRRLRRSREMACDEIAARLMRSRSRYAQCLFDLAQSSFGQPRTATEALALFNDPAKPSTLEERIMQLTKEKTTVTLRSALARIAGGALPLAGALVVAAIVHVTPVLASPVAAQQPPAIAQAPAAPALPPLPPAVAGDAAPAEQKIETNKECSALELHTEVNVPELQIEIQNARRAAEEAKRQIESPEFKRQIEEARDQAMNNPKLKAEMEALQRQFQSGEFKKQMAEMQQQFQSGEFKKQMEEMRNQLDQMKITLKEQSRELEKARKAADEAKAQHSKP